MNVKPGRVFEPDSPESDGSMVSFEFEESGI